MEEGVAAASDSSPPAPEDDEVDTGRELVRRVLQGAIDQGAQPAAVAEDAERAESGDAEPPLPAEAAETTVKSAVQAPLATVPLVVRVILAPTEGSSAPLRVLIVPERHGTAELAEATETLADPAGASRQTVWK